MGSHCTAWDWPPSAAAIFRVVPAACTDAELATGLAVELTALLLGGAADVAELADAAATDDAATDVVAGAADVVAADVVAADVVAADVAAALELAGAAVAAPEPAVG